MFWTNIYTLSPHIEALLNKEDVTLQELMDQEEIVAECKSQNKKLVEFLTRPEIIEELVTLTTKEPSEDIDERSRYKYPNIACELLTCNVPTLNEKLGGSVALLEKLYSFIDTDEELNPLLASFFSKIIGVLLIRKSDQNWYSYQFMCLQVLEFLKSRDTCVDRLLQHLNTSAIMDLILKLITKVEGTDMVQNVKQWLDDKKLIQQLIELLKPTIDNNRHTNSSQLLCDIIKLSRENRLLVVDRTLESDPILDTLESEETVSLLLDTILAEPQMETSIIGGIQVLLVLLGQESTSQQTTTDMQGNNFGDDPNESVDRVKIQNATLQYLEKLHKLLVTPPPKPAVKTTAGLLDCPLGNTRLHIAKLFTALLSTENIKVFQKLQEFGTFQTLLDLFFKYSWNNFLHIQVEQCLALLINGNWQEQNESIYTHIFTQCKLFERILEAWENNNNEQKSHKGVRQGYMGHLISIANNIVKQTEKCENFDKFLKTNVDKICYDKWENLVNTQLAEINKTNEILLGGKLQAYMTSSEDSSEDYNSYSQDTYVQQVYSNYQGQQMTSQVIEHYGFHDDEFNDGNDALQPTNSVDQLSTMPFSMNEEDLVKQEDMFNKICQQKQKSGLDEGGIEWGDEGELTFQTVIDKRDWPFKQQQHDSMSSDDDEETKDLHMEIDTTDPWVTDALTNKSNTNSLQQQVSPWDIDSSTSDDTANWANFDNFENTLPNFDVNNEKIIDDNNTQINIDLNINKINNDDNKLSDCDDVTLTIKQSNDGNNEILKNDIIVPETTTNIDDNNLSIIDDVNSSKQEHNNLSITDRVIDDKKVEDKITVAKVTEEIIDTVIEPEILHDKPDVNADALSITSELEAKASDKSKTENPSEQPSGSLTTL